MKQPTKAKLNHKIKALEYYIQLLRLTSQYKKLNKKL